MCGPRFSFEKSLKGNEMSFDADLLFDRRRLKRALTVWRLIAIAAVAGLVVALAGGLGGSGSPWGRDHVARVDIDGIIFNDRDRIEALQALIGASHVKAVIIHIDSPGGTFAGGETLYHTLRRLAADKPTVAVMGGTATSAGYMVAIAADHVIARAGTLTGSIGVILQSADVTGLLQKLGVQPEIFKSGPLKAQPNPLEPLTDTARAATQTVLMDLYQQFVDLVVERRKLGRDKVLELADGRVFSGRAAKAADLVDEIGGEAEARSWLLKTHEVSQDLPIQDLSLPGEGGSWREALGLYLKKALFSERLRLDGVFSLWHPSL